MKGRALLTIYYLAAFLSGPVFYVAYYRASSLPRFVGVALLFVIALSFLFSFVRGKAIPGSGILSLFLLFGILGSLELTLDSMSRDDNNRSKVDAKPLTVPDQVNIVYKKHGFRGTRVSAGKAEDAIRIITMGGSSTYGIPMVSPSLTYTSQFARLLEERRPGEKYQVLNGGIAGFGITQIVASLKEELLQYKPDIVTVCAWFNDSASQPGWYGYQGMSDKEGYYLHRFLERFDRSRIFSPLYRSRSFDSFRTGLLKIQARFLFSKKADSKDGKKKDKENEKSKGKRMSPQEFAWGLEEIVKLGKENDFLPVLILEPLNRTPTLEDATKRNKYYKQMLDVAKKYGLPVVNPLNEMAPFRDQWLFHDFIHPNSEGHRIIANELYSTLFEKEKAPALDRFFIQHNLKDLPSAQRGAAYVFESDDNRVPSEVRAQLRAPFSTDDETFVDLRVNGKTIARSGPLTQSLAEYKIPLTALPPLFPLNEIQIQPTVPLRSKNSDFLIGETKIHSPVSLKVISGGKGAGWRVRILVEGVRYDLDGQGYNLVVLDRASGKVLNARFFDPARGNNVEQKLLAELCAISREFKDNVIVALAVKGDGVGQADREILKQAFNKIGGSGAVPGRFHSFALVGVPGAAAGTALESLGNELLTLEIGDGSFTSTLIDVASIEISDQNGATFKPQESQ